MRERNKTRDPAEEVAERRIRAHSARRVVGLLGPGSRSLKLASAGTRDRGARSSTRSTLSSEDLGDQSSCPGRVQRALLRERNETRDPAEEVAERRILAHSARRVVGLLGPGSRSLKLASAGTRDRGARSSGTRSTRSSEDLGDQSSCPGRVQRAHWRERNETRDPAEEVAERRIRAHSARRVAGLLGPGSRSLKLASAGTRGRGARSSGTRSTPSSEDLGDQSSCPGRVKRSGTRPGTQRKKSRSAVSSRTQHAASWGSWVPGLVRSSSLRPGHEIGALARPGHARPGHERFRAPTRPSNRAIAGSSSQ